MERKQKSFSTNESPVYDWKLYIWILSPALHENNDLFCGYYIYSAPAKTWRSFPCRWDWLIQMNPYKKNHSAIERKWDLTTSTDQSTSQLKSSDAARLCLASNEASPSGSDPSGVTLIIHYTRDLSDFPEPSRRSGITQRRRNSSSVTHQEPHFQIWFPEQHP